MSRRMTPEEMRQAELKADAERKNLKGEIQDLQRTAAIERKPVSECMKDLLAYTQQHSAQDALVSGIPPAQENPWQPKKKCDIV